MKLGAQLARLKSENGLTTEALSQRSGVPRGTLNKLLNGETRNPTVTTLSALAEALVSGAPLTGTLEKHAPWAEELQTRYTFTPENAAGILETEVGRVFARVLEHAGVYKRNAAGKEAFMRFVGAVNGE